MLLYHNIVIISSYHHFSQALCLLLSILIKSCVSVNVTQILLAFGHENMLNLFYFDVQGIDVTFQPAALRLRPTFLRIICGQKQKNDTRPFFTLAFTVPDKRHAAQAAPQIWDKAIGQLFASYHFPLNNKERDTKKKSQRRAFCFVSPTLPLSFLRLEDRRLYITYKAGDIFLLTGIMAYHTVRVPLSFRSNLFRKFVEAAEGWRSVALARLGGSEGWRRKAKVGESGVLREHRFHLEGGSCRLCIAPCQCQRDHISRHRAEARRPRAAWSPSGLCDVHSGRSH